MNYLLNKRLRFIYKPFIWGILIAFCASLLAPFPGSQAYAQSVSAVAQLPLPQMLLAPTPAFTPTLIKGLKIFPDNPLHFNFIIDRGDKRLDGQDLKNESRKLIKYFLTSLTVPDDDLWVNLSPNEHEAVVTDSFGQTEMGQDMLAQDYQLKQLSASLLSPETPLGKDFWQRVYAKAYEVYGTTDIPADTLQRIWIVPDKVRVYENESSAFVVESHLRVLSEEDYLVSRESYLVSRKKNISDFRDTSDEIRDTSSQIMKEILLPAIEKEVNEGSHFANLRQIFHSMILATWYKQNLKRSIINQIYSEKNKIKGVESLDKDAKEIIYQRYLESIKKGIFNYVKEEYDADRQEVVPRKYFSGGMKAWKKEIEKNFDTTARAEEVDMGPDEAMMADVNLVPEGKQIKQKAAEQLSGKLTELNSELDRNLAGQDVLKRKIDALHAEDLRNPDFEQIDTLENHASALREQAAIIRENIQRVKRQIEIAASEDKDVAELFAWAAAPDKKMTQEELEQKVERAHRISKRRAEILRTLNENNWNIGDMREKLTITKRVSVYSLFEHYGLLDVLKEKVVSALNKHHGNRKLAAREIGITGSWTFDRLISDFKIRIRKEKRTVRDFSREEVIEFLEKSDWDLGTLRRQIRSDKGWPNQTVYNYFANLNLLDSLKAQIIAKLRKHNLDYQAAADEFGIAIYTLQGLVKAFDITEEQIKSNQLIPIEKNTKLVDTMSDLDVIDWFDYRIDESLKPGGVLFGLTATKAEHGFRVGLYASADHSKVLYIRDDQVKGLYLGDRFNVVLAVYPDINQGPILAIFDENSYWKWKTGDKSVYPIGTYSQNFRYSKPFTSFGSSRRKKPTIADMFVDDLKALSQGKSITIRAPKFRWSYIRQALIVNKNKNQKGPMAAVRFGQQGTDIDNKTIFRIPPDIVKKYHLRHKEQVIGVMIDHPVHGVVAQVYREADFNKDDHTRSVNPLVTYGFKDGKWQELELNQVEMQPKTDQENFVATVAPSKNPYSVPLSDEEMREQFPLQFKVDERGHVIPLPLTYSELVEWIQGVKQLAPGRVLEGMRLKKVEKNYQVFIKVKGFDVPLAIRNEWINEIIDNYKHEENLEDVVLATFIDPDLGSVLGIFSRNAYQDWLNGTRDRYPLAVYANQAVKIPRYLDRFTERVKLLQEGVELKGDFIREGPWEWKNRKVFVAKNQEGKVTIKAFGQSISFYISPEKIREFDVKKGDEVQLQFEDIPGIGRAVIIYRAKDVSDEPRYSSALVTYAYLRGQNGLKGWTRIDDIEAFLAELSKKKESVSKAVDLNAENSLRSLMREMSEQEGPLNDLSAEPGEREVYQYASALREGTIGEIQKAKNKLLKAEPFEMEATVNGFYFGSLNGQKVNIVIPGVKKARVSVHEDPLGNPYLKIVNLRPKKEDEKKVWYFDLNSNPSGLNQESYFTERRRPGIEEFTMYLIDLIDGNEEGINNYVKVWSRIPKFKLKAQKDGEYKEYGVITLATINGEDITIRLEGLEEAEIEPAIGEDQKPYFILHPILKRDGKKKKSKRSIEYAFKNTPGYIERSEAGNVYSVLISNYLNALNDGKDKERIEQTKKDVLRHRIFRLRSPNGRFSFGSYKGHPIEIFIKDAREIEMKAIEGKDGRIYFVVNVIDITYGKYQARKFYGLLLDTANVFQIQAVNDEKARELDFLEFKSDVEEFYAQPSVSETAGKRRASQYFGTMQEYGPGRFDRVLDLRPFETTLINGEISLNAYSYGNNLSTDFLKWKSTKATVTPILVEADNHHRSGMLAYLKIEGDYVDEKGGREVDYLYFNRRALKFNPLTELPGIRAINSFWYAIKSEYNHYEEKSLFLAKEFSKRIGSFTVESTTEGIIWEKASYLKKPNIPINHQGPVEISFIFDRNDESYLKVVIPKTDRIPEQTIYFKMTDSEQFFEQVNADQIEFEEKQIHSHEAEDDGLAVFKRYLEARVDLDITKIIESKKAVMQKGIFRMRGVNGRFSFGSYKGHNFEMIFDGVKEIEVKFIEGESERIFLAVDFIETSDGKKREREFFDIVHTVAGAFFIRPVDDRTAQDFKRHVFKSDIDAFYAQPSVSAEEGKKRAGKYFGNLKRWGVEGEDTVLKLRPFDMSLENGEINLSELYESAVHTDFLKWKSKKAHITPILVPGDAGHPSGLTAILKVEGDYVDQKQGREVACLFFNRMDLRLIRMIRPGYSSLYSVFSAIRYSPNKIHYILAKELFRKIYPFTVNASRRDGIVWDDRFSQLKMPDIPVNYNGPVELSSIFDKNDEPYLKVTIPNQHPRYFRMVNTQEFFQEVKADQIEFAKQRPSPQQEISPNTGILLQYISTMMDVENENQQLRKKEIEEAWYFTSSYEMEADEHGTLHFGKIGDRDVFLTIPRLKKAKVTPMSSYGKSFLVVRDVEASTIQGRVWYFSFLGEAPFFVEREAPELDLMRLYLEAMDSHGYKSAKKSKEEVRQIEQYKKFWRESEIFPVPVTKDGEDGVAHLGTVNGHDITIRVKGMVGAVTEPKEKYNPDTDKSHIYFRFAPIFESDEDGKPKLENTRYYTFKNEPDYIEEADDSGRSKRVSDIESIANFMGLLQWKKSFKDEKEIKKRIADARENLRLVKFFRLQSDNGRFRMIGAKLNEYKNVHYFQFPIRVKEIEVTVVWDQNDNPYFKVEFIKVGHGEKETVYRGISNEVKLVLVNPDGSARNQPLYPYEALAKEHKAEILKNSDWQANYVQLFSYYQAQFSRDENLMETKRQELVKAGAVEMEADEKGKLVFGHMGDFEVAVRIPGLKRARVTALPLPDLYSRSKSVYLQIENLDLKEDDINRSHYYYLDDIPGSFTSRLANGVEEIHQYILGFAEYARAHMEHYENVLEKLESFYMLTRKEGDQGILDFGEINGHKIRIAKKNLVSAEITIHKLNHGPSRIFIGVVGTYTDGTKDKVPSYYGLINVPGFIEEVNQYGENARTYGEQAIRSFILSSLNGEADKARYLRRILDPYFEKVDFDEENISPKQMMKLVVPFRKRGKNGKFPIVSWKGKQYAFSFSNVNEIEVKVLFDHDDNPYFEVTFTETENGRKSETVYVGFSNDMQFIRVNGDGSKIKTEWEEVKELAEIFSKPVQVLDNNPGALLDVMLTLGPNYYKPEKMRRLVRRFHELNLRELHKKTKKASPTGNAGVLLEFYFEQAKLIDQKDERARTTLIEVYKNAAFHDLTKPEKKVLILKNLKEGASKGKFFLELYEAVKNMVEVDMVYQPDHLRTSFDPYQAIGSYFLRGRERAFLGDPTGAGKTIEVLGALNPADKNLIAMPAHLIENWRKEISKHFTKETLSKTDVIVISGTRAQRLQLMDSLKDKKNCIILFSISSMREHTKAEMAGLLNDLDLFVMDESQYVANFKGFGARGNAQQAEIVQHVDAKRKWFLSATGYGSDPKQLFALLHNLTKGTPEHKNFEDYRTFIHLFPTDTPHGLRLLRAELRRIGLSRLQDEIMERYEDPNVTPLKEQGRRLPNVNEIPYEQMGGYTLNEEQVMLLFRMIYNFRDYARWYNERVPPEKQLNESNMHPFKKLQFIFDLMLDPKLVGGTTESPIYQELDKIMAHYAELGKKGILTRHHDYVLNALMERYKDQGITRIDGSGSDYAHKDGKVLKGYFENGELILDSDHPQARRISERLYQQYLFQKDPNHRINILQEQSGVGVDLTAADFMVYVQLAKVFTRELQVDGRFIRPDENNPRYMVDKIHMIAEFPENLMELVWGTPYFRLAFAMLKPGSKADLRLKELVKENDEWAQAVRLVKQEAAKDLKRKNKDALHVNYSELRDLVEDPEALLNTLYENEIIDRNGYINDDFWRIDHKDAFQKRFESPYDDETEEKIFDALNAKLKGVGTPVEMQLNRLKVQEEIYKYLMTDLATKDEIDLFNFGSFVRSIPGLMEDVTMDEYLNSLSSRPLRKTLDVFRELYFKADSMELQREILRIAESFFRSGQIKVNNQLINLLKKGDETFAFLMGSLRDIPNKYARNQWAQRIIKMVTEDIPEEDMNFEELLEEAEFLVDNAGFLILPLYEATKGYQNGAAIQTMTALLSEVNDRYRDDYQKRQTIYHDVLLWMLAVDSDAKKGDKRDDLKLVLDKYSELLTNPEFLLNDRLQILQEILRLISFPGAKEILLAPEANDDPVLLKNALMNVKIKASQTVFSLSEAEARALVLKFPALMTALQFQKTLITSFGFERQTKQMNEMIRRIIAGDFDDWRNKQIGLREGGSFVDFLGDAEHDKFWEIFTREEGVTLDGLEIDVDMNRQQISQMSSRIYERITVNNAKLVGDVDGDWVQHQFDNWSKRPMSEFRKLGMVRYHLAKAKAGLIKGRALKDLPDEQQDAIRLSNFNDGEDMDRLKKEIDQRLNDFQRLEDWLTLSHWLASLERKPPKPEEIAEHRILLSKFIGRTDKLPIMISDELDNFSIALENMNIRNRFSKLYIQFTTNPSLMIERGMFNAQLTDCFNCYADPQQFSTLIDDLGSRNKILALVREGGPDGRILARSVVKVKRSEDGKPVIFPERPLKIGNYSFENEILKAFYASKMTELKKFGTELGREGKFKDQRVKMFATGGYGDSEYIEPLFSVRSHDQEIYHRGVIVTHLFGSETAGSTASAPADSALLATEKIKPENPGGIDLTPKWMNIKTEGKSVDFHIFFNPSELENMAIEGFSPVIINITPVTNLPLLLGIKKGDESTELSKL